MKIDIVKATAWAFIIFILLFIGISAVAPVPQFIKSNVLGSAQASDVGPMATKPPGDGIIHPSINPCIKPYPSLPRISLPPPSPTPTPPGGTFTYDNPTTPTPTVMPSVAANITLTTTPTVEATAPAEVPTATPIPTPAKKGILGLGIGLPCGSLLVLPLVICGAIVIGMYKRKRE